MAKYVPIRTQVRLEVDRFLKASGMSPSKFGQLVMGDTRFVPRLRDPEGQPIKSSTIDKIRTWIPGEGKKFLQKAEKAAKQKPRMVRRAVRKPAAKAGRTKLDAPKRRRFARAPA